MNFRELLYQHPFFRILLPLLTGILLADLIILSKQATQVFLLLAFVIFALFVSIPPLKRSFAFGFVVFLLFFAIGTYRTQTTQENMLLQHEEENTFYKVQLIRNLVEKENSYATIAKVYESVHNKQLKPETAHTVLYFQKDNLSNTTLKAGDCLLIHSKLKQVKNEGNPCEFDYANYLQSIHTLYSSYVSKKNWHKLTPEHQNLRTLAWRWRGRLLNIYKENGIKNESFEILAALTLGYKTGLNPEIRQAWADAGALHVLAVSGLHVGIVYLVMSYLLKFLKHVKYGNQMRCLLLLLILWMYALITGLSPSVMRASCMFSFIVIGETMNRKGGIFNSLAASACFLLFYDPYMLFSIGFQFSYFAVAGIVFLQPKLSALLYVKNPILNEFWQLTTVSLSAQMATFPLTVYYFNQFPSYFLLSGYIVILMAAILIYLSALLLLVSKIHFLSNSLGWILQKMTENLHQIMIWIQDLPGAVIQKNFSLYQVILLYLMVFSLIFILILKRKKALYVLLFLMIAIQMPKMIHSLKKNKTELIVFNAGQNSLMALKSGQNIHYLCNKEISKLKFERLTKNFHLKNRIQNVKTDTLYQDIDFRMIAGKKLLVVGEHTNKLSDLLHELKPDILWLRESALQTNSQLLKNRQELSIVLDGSVYYSDLQKFKAMNHQGIKQVFFASDGACFLDLSALNKTK